MEQYYPKRDRGVYRAAANPKSKIHGWGKKLVSRLESPTHIGQLNGFLAWCYRQKGFENPIKYMMYSKNPFLSLIPKEEPTGKYIPVPIKYGK